MMAAKPGVNSNFANAQLCNLLWALPNCRGLSEALRAIEQAFLAATGSPVAIFSESGQVLLHSPGFRPSPDHVKLARRVIESGKALDDSLPAGSQICNFLPLTTWRGVLGAFAFPSDGLVKRWLWPVVHSFANQTALSMLRCASEADRLQDALLNSIAHNVRTPLASIIGVLSTLQEDRAALEPMVRQELLDTARQEADRLNRLLGNLLDFSRIESRAVRVRADPCDVQDVIGAALEQLGGRARERAVEVAIAPDLPLVRMDFALIVQVLVNMLDNSLKYSAPPGSVKIQAQLTCGQFEIRVEDEGDGIDDADLDRVFEKFNRARRTGETGGIGLGLSICKGLIEAHSGCIWAERRHPSGTAVVFRLPLL